MNAQPRRHNAKLDPQEVAVIKARLSAGVPMARLARDFNVSVASIAAIHDERSYRWVQPAASLTQ